MSTESTQKRNTEVKCPECEKTLYRGDLRRHRSTQHPDGAVVKLQCPFAGCQYKTAQRSNLKTHINARHTTVSQILCPTCNKCFSDPASRINHRKKFHGYKPYHTPQYLARRALKEAEQKRNKVALSKTCNQQAASVVTSSANASSSMDNLNLNDATYYTDFWKPLVDAPLRDASELKVSQGVQISIPVSVAPAWDIPGTLHSNSDLYLPNVGQQPFTTQKLDGTFLLGPKLDTTVQPQSQTLAPSWTAYDQIPGVASDYRPFAATFPASEGQSTYPGMGLKSLPAFTFPEVPSAMPNPFNFPTTSTAPSSSRISGNQFVFPNYMATPPPLQLPALSWTPSLSPASSTPLSQTEIFTGEAKRGFDTWDMNIATTSRDTPQPF